MRFARRLKKSSGKFRFRGRIQTNLKTISESREAKPLTGHLQMNCSLHEISGLKAGRKRPALIPMNERENAATRAARHNLGETTHGCITQVRREIGHHEE